jgi:hypothetical protein
MFFFFFFFAVPELSPLRPASASSRRLHQACSFTNWSKFLQSLSGLVTRGPVVRLHFVAHFAAGRGGAGAGRCRSLRALWRAQDREQSALENARVLWRRHVKNVLEDAVSPHLLPSAEHCVWHGLNVPCQ